MLYDTAPLEQGGVGYTFPEPPFTGHQVNIITPPPAPPYGQRSHVIRHSTLEEGGVDHTFSEPSFTCHQVNTPPPPLWTWNISCYTTQHPGAKRSGPHLSRVILYWLYRPPGKYCSPSTPWRTKISCYMTQHPGAKRSGPHFSRVILYWPLGILHGIHIVYWRLSCCTTQAPWSKEEWATLFQSLSLLATRYFVTPNPLADTDLVFKK